MATETKSFEECLVEAHATIDEVKHFLGSVSVTFIDLNLKVDRIGVFSGIETQDDIQEPPLRSYDYPGNPFTTLNDERWSRTNTYDDFSLQYHPLSDSTVEFKRNGFTGISVLSISNGDFIMRGDVELPVNKGLEEKLKRSGIVGHGALHLVRPRQKDFCDPVFATHITLSASNSDAFRA